MSEKTYEIAVSMIHHGMNMVVKSNTRLVDRIVSECIEWASRDRNEAISAHKSLKNKLLREDNFFNKYPKAALVNKQRWNDFCNSCIDFVALNAALFEEPIHLIHPDQYNKQRTQSNLDLASKGNVDLIPGVKVIREAA